MNNKLYFLGKWFNRHSIVVNIIIFSILIVTGITQFMVDKNTILKLFGIYTFIILFTLFRIRLNHITIDMREFNIPTEGEAVIITKDFYYDGTFRKYINTSDTSRKPNTIYIKKGEEWVIDSVSTLLGDDWIITIKDQYGETIRLEYIETRKHWETKSDFRNNRLKELGI